MSRITIICPTRARPRQFARMVETAMFTAHDKNNIGVYFYVAQDDPKLNAYPELPQCNLVTGPDWPAVMCSNWMAALREPSESDIVMVGADDMIFATPHWDKAVLEHYDGLRNKAHVYSFRDSRDEHGTPHPLLTREYVKAMGYFLPPVFLHWYVDSWTAQIARTNGCFTHLKDYLVIHDKPSDMGMADETHNRIRRLGWHDRDEYVDRTCKHFMWAEAKRLGETIR